MPNSPWSHHRSASLSDDIDFEIKGQELQFLEIELDPGESAVAEAGAMVWKDGAISMTTVFGDGSQTRSFCYRDDLVEGINTMAQALQSAQGELQQNVEQATEDLRQTLETIEVQNIELDMARKAAQEASRIKSEFLANMSHELRTPLNGIIGFSNLLQRTEMTTRQSEYLDTISKSAGNLLAIINEILDFSKIEAGKLTLESMPFNLRDQIEEALTILAPAAHQKQIELVSLIYSDVPLGLKGDALRLKQILSNLLSNAIKFTHVGSVCLRVMLEEENDSEATLRIDQPPSGPMIIAPMNIGMSVPTMTPMVAMAPTTPPRVLLSPYPIRPPV